MTQILTAFAEKFPINNTRPILPQNEQSYKLSSLLQNGNTVFHKVHLVLESLDLTFYKFQRFIDQMFENPYSVDDKVQSTRSSSQRAFQDLKAATPRRMQREPDYLNPTLSLDIRGSSPGYSSLKKDSTKDVQKPNKYAHQK